MGEIVGFVLIWVTLTRLKRVTVSLYPSPFALVALGLKNGTHGAKFDRKTFKKGLNHVSGLWYKLT